MLATLGSASEQLVQQLGLLGLVLLMAAEHIFPPIPSELVLPLAGFEVARGNLSFAGALIASTVGSLVGASALYALARRGGRSMVLRWRRVLRVDAAALERAELRFARHATKVVLLGRMVPGLRSLVSLPAGLLRMPFGRYLILTAAGSLAWNALLIGLGQQLGRRWGDVAGVLGPLAQVVLVALALAAGAWLFLRRTRARSLKRPG